MHSTNLAAKVSLIASFNLAKRFRLPTLTVYLNVAGGFCWCGKPCIRPKNGQSEGVKHQIFQQVLILVLHPDTFCCTMHNVNAQLVETAD